jgi:phosphoribosyl 1,2-cyclic phosphodiesterase
MIRRGSLGKNVCSEVLLTFRGSITSPGAHTIVFGGNTSCVRLESRNHIVILNAGSGLRELGRYLMKREEFGPITANIFLSHMHWDHIQGLPFFVPGRLEGSVRVRLFLSTPLRAGLSDVGGRKLNPPVGH